MKRFDGKAVIVTGASRGIGRAIALAFASEGAFVYVNYRARERDARETLGALQEAGGQGALLAFDVRERHLVDEAVARVVDQHGRVDVLVNNAAVVRDSAFTLMSREDWTEVIDVNLGGVFNCLQAVAREMMRAGGGVVINIGSVAGLNASPGQVNYSSSKGGVVALTRTLAAELAPRGIRVNSIIPGMIAAGMVARLDRAAAERRREHIPLGRFGDPDEVARVALFLASDDASYIVGQALVVDGGLSL